jgi:bacterioferritin
MGKHAVKISNLDTEKLIQMLNEALAEEWLAYYQYWVGAKVMEGPMRSEIEPELIVHATEELAHAELVAGRIIQLGGTPLLNPDQWKKFAKCDYEEPTDPYVEVILNQNLRGERCAIQRYQDIAEYTAGKDFSTYQMAIQIMNDELEHEEDIEAWINDLEVMKENFKKLRM